MQNGAWLSQPPRALWLTGPAPCARFYRKLRRRTNKPDMLEGVRFAVLGLGDTNYSQFWCGWRRRAPSLCPAPR